MKHKKRKRCQPPNLGNLPAQPAHAAWIWWLAPFLLLAVAGCGSGGPPRLRVVGAVTLDGKPLADGAISFMPAGKGVAAGATIAGGHYVVEGARGPTPGEYRVEIRASAPSGKQVKDSFGQASISETESIIPARYNDKTTLRVEITAAGPNQFDYSLSTSPAPE
jgi:hypothetical protein